MFCPQCGENLPEGSKFCLKCGFNVASISQSTTTPIKAQPRTRKEIAKESLKKGTLSLGHALGKGAVITAKVAARHLPKLLQMTSKQLEDFIEEVSKEEDSGVENGTKGREFERLVANIFEVRRYRIIQRNYHFEEREIDLIAAHGKDAVAVECKARTASVGTKELDSYIKIFMDLKSKQPFKGVRIKKFILVAPKGGLSSDAKNKGMRELGSALEIWDRTRFREELRKERKTLRIK